MEGSLVSCEFLNLSALWRSWFRHCATSLKIVGSIPDGVIGISHWHNPSSNRNKYQEYENCALLRYYAASSGNSLPDIPKEPIGPIFNHYSLYSNPEERSSHLLRGGSLKSRIQRIFPEG